MKRIVLISVLCLIFQIIFAQKQDTILTLSPEISFLATAHSSNSSINDLNLVSKFDTKVCICSNPQLEDQTCKSKAVDIARNSEGKHGEGRLPNAYSASLSKPIILKPITVIGLNGKHGEGLFPSAYSKSLRKSHTNVRVDDIARNCAGRNSN